MRPHAPACPGACSGPRTRDGVVAGERDVELGVAGEAERLADRAGEELVALIARLNLEAVCLAAEVDVHHSWCCHTNSRCEHRLPIWQDFAAEIAQIRAAKPDFVFQFHPGGAGIAFLRQYQQAGLLSEIPMVVPSPSMDAVTLKAIGEAAIGVNVSAQWNSDFDNAANKAFVEAWKKKYNDRPITYYASQGYDTALAIGAALKGTGGKVDDTKAFRTAMLKADFASVRGNFKFGNNQHPVQDWYSMKVVKGDGGAPIIKTNGKISSGTGDFYAKDCKI
jgi:hypothetical protein